MLAVEIAPVSLELDSAESKREVECAEVRVGVSTTL
jgi:hypothetical protein